MSDTKAQIRVTLQQPLLPAYRVPVFEALSKRPGIDLTVYYGDRKEGPKNVDHAPFKAECVHLYERAVGRRTVMWHPPQWQCASSRVSDVLILSWDLQYASLVPGLLRAKANGVRTILWGHGYSKNEASLRQRLRERVGKFADATLFYNQSTADQYVERGFKSHRVFAAPNAIDQRPIQAALQHWTQRPGELNAFKEKNGINPGPVILFVSRLDPDNRLDLLLQSIQQLKTRFPDIQAVIIGKGDKELNKLKKIVGEFGIEKNVRFLGPIYDERQLAPWFMSAKLFCYPANIGLSILHAFGYGLPVITSDNRAAQNPEIESLQDGYNGLVYADGEADALAETLARVLDDPAMQQKLAANAHETATDTYSLTAMVDGMEAAIRG